jgi:C4-dicarboxylate-specific signal transduction histidine kinase
LFTDRLRSVLRSGARERSEGHGLMLATVFGHALVLAVALWLSLVEGSQLPADARSTLLVGLVAMIAASTLLLVRNARQASLLRETARARRREAQEAFTLLEALSENTPAVFVMVRSDGVIVHANRMAERLGGRPLTGMRCSDVAFGSQDLRCATCPWRTLPAGTACPGSPQGGDTDDHLVFAHHALELPGGERRLVLMGRLLTEQKRLQEQLFHRERLATLGMLTAGVAHDLGNPLAALLATVQRLEHEPLSDGARETVHGLRADLSRLSRSLRELVDFSRRRREDRYLASAGTLVEDVLRILRHDPRMRDVQVSTDLDPETPPIHVVEDHLVQVLLNLVINALDAMPEGGRIGVSVGEKDDAVQITITDSGTGMPEHVLALAFEPLFTTKPPGRGAGLGLSICRDVLAAHGGDVHLISRPGAGTTAIVRVPAWRPETAPGAKPSALPAAACPPA